MLHTFPTVLHCYVNGMVTDGKTFTSKYAVNLNIFYVYCSSLNSSNLNFLSIQILSRTEKAAKAHLSVITENVKTIYTFFKVVFIQ